MASRGGLAKTTTVKSRFGENLLGRRPVITFFILAIVISWWPWYTGIATEASPFVPSLLAIILTAVIAGKRGVGSLLRSAVQWRAPISVWAVALLTLPGLYLLAIGINSATGGEAPPFDAFRADQHLIPVFLLFNLLPFFGPVGEELGWRGFALPRLAGPAGPVLASIIIGVVWGIWHLPDFFADEGVLGTLGLVWLVPYVLGTIANSVFMTYLWARSGGSVLIAGITWHAGTNYWAAMLLSDLRFEDTLENDVTPTIDATLYGITLAVLVTAALGLVVATKGRLGLEQEAGDPALAVSSEPKRKRVGHA